MAQKAFAEEQLQELALLTLKQRENKMSMNKVTIEPVAVGLSDEQVDNLANTLWSKLDTDTFYFVINKWLKTQTFTQHEQYPNTAPPKREPLVDSVIDNYLEHFEGSKLAFWEGVLWAEEQHGIGVDDDN